MNTVVVRLAFSVLVLFPLLGASAESPWIELSYPFNNETIYWPTAESFKHIEVFENFTTAGYYYASYDISASEHGGTHLDAPRHFAEGKWTADEIPLDRLIGPAIKIDISSKAAQVIIPESKEKCLDLPINVVWILIFETGFSSTWFMPATVKRRTEKSSNSRNRHSIDKIEIDLRPFCRSSSQV